MPQVLAAVVGATAVLFASYLTGRNAQKGLELQGKLSVNALRVTSEESERGRNALVSENDKGRRHERLVAWTREAASVYAEVIALSEELSMTFAEKVAHVYVNSDARATGTLSREHAIQEEEWLDSYMSLKGVGRKLLDSLSGISVLAPQYKTVESCDSLRAALSEYIGSWYALMESECVRLRDPGGDAAEDRRVRKDEFRAASHVLSEQSRFFRDELGALVSRETERGDAISESGPGA